MGIVCALLPALFWGFMPLIVKKVGGRPTNGILGTVMGALIVGILIQLGTHPQAINWQTFLVSMFAGACWVIGQVGQFAAYNKISVTTTMPISTALQLIGTSLIGVFVFGEWPSMFSKIVGFGDIILLIIGVALTTVGGEKGNNHRNMKQGLAILLLTSIGYWIYSAVPKAIHVPGTAMFFPQMLGAFLAAAVYVLLVDRHTFVEKKTWKNIIAGILWSIAAFLYIIAAKQIGIATAFTITQLCVVISTLGGIVFLHEHKNARELRFTLFGLALVVLGSFITAFL
ncbi:MAG: GRP family sugar transporter [Candidatus Paralactobacillus gallistercoris]|uniref:GRP family sugar transporter n=1 Tax=Candidatus Paralactobacillus gallistercoris TaxID=2838724 RepID=A0A948TK96_9LACO|nr:GRP family sugar transporter [Candidatus Paralactobacillus gallistercoris]